MTHLQIPFSSLGEDDQQQKNLILEELGIPQTSFEITAQCALPQNLILASRIYHMDSVEVYFSRTPNQTLLEHVSSPISPQNEMRTLIFLTKEFEKIQDDAARQAAKIQLNILIEQYSRNVPVSQASEVLKDEMSVALMRWAEENEIVSHVELADFTDTGRGMALKSSIGANEPLIECDAGLFISIFTAMASPALGPIFSQLTQLDEDTILILFVIYEKFANPNSFWKPYLDLLPESIDSGLFFDSTERSYAAGTMLEYEMAMTLEQFENVYAEIVECIQPFKDVFTAELCSLDHFLWARAMFDSRGFNLNIKGKARNCLLPFIDSINTMHYSHLQNRGRIEENHRGKSDLGTFVLPTLSPCTSIGSQVFLNYGGFSTRELVLFYGFAYDGEGENPYDSWDLDLDPPEEDQAEERKALASVLNITNEHYLKAHRLSSDLLCYMSILTLPSAEIPKAQKLDPTSLRAFLLQPSHMNSIKDTLESLISGLKDNLLEQNPFLSQPKNAISFPSNRAKLAYLYAKSQLHILESTAAMISAIKVQ